jgi:hypothetical protein
MSPPLVLKLLLMREAMEGGVERHRRACAVGGELFFPFLRTMQ